MFKILISSILIPVASLSQTVHIADGSKLNVDGDNKNNTTFDCDGSIYIQGTLDLDDDAKVYCGGDFIKDQASFTRGKSTVVFDGNIAQEISGGILSKTSFGFYNLTIDNVNGVSINTNKIGAITIYNTLFPKKGTFSTNNALKINALSATNYGRVAHGSGQVNGKVTVEKDLTNTQAGWRQISLPIIGKLDSAGFTGLTILYHSHFPANQRNIYTYNSTASGNNDYAIGYEAASATDNQSKAYTIYSDNTNGLHNISAPFSCYGTLNTGNQYHSLDFTRDPIDLNAANDQTKGWNFIPNPWAALINVDSLLKDFTNFTSNYKAIHVWDATNQNYRAILGNGVSNNISHNTTGVNLSANNVNIPPMQGFWVKSSAPGQVCNLIEANIRTTDLGTSASFMKSELDLVRFYVWNEDSLWDQLVVYFDPNASYQFEEHLDAYKMDNSNSIVPYLSGLEGNYNAAIIARPGNIVDSVTFSYKAATNSNFFFRMDSKKLKPFWMVTLKDRLTGKIYNLNQIPALSFTNSANGMNRFVVYFHQTDIDVLQNPQVTSKQELIYLNDRILLNNSDYEGNIELSIFDLSGRMIFQRTLSVKHNTQYTISTDLEHGVFIIHIKTNQTQFTDKIMR